MVKIRSATRHRLGYIYQAQTKQSRRSTRQSALKLSVTSVYPGRLYVQDMPAFIDSLDRMLGLAESRAVRQVMGCHIEMSRTPGHDYPLGTKYQPREPPLQM